MFLHNVSIHLQHHVCHKPKKLQSELKGCTNNIPSRELQFSSMFYEQGLYMQAMRHTEQSGNSYETRMSYML
jgi:hypothetical protein